MPLWACRFESYSRHDDKFGFNVNGLTQLVECQSSKLKVVGSSPIPGAFKILKKVGYSLMVKRWFVDPESWVRFPLPAFADA